VIEVASLYVGLRKPDHHCSVVEGKRRRNNLLIFGISGERLFRYIETVADLHKMGVKIEVARWHICVIGL